MRYAGTLLVFLASQATMIAPAAAAHLSSKSQKVYEATVKPFLKAHCIVCHNEKVARAAFRVDNLSTDFLAGKTADQWKEIYDRINKGDKPDGMPPKKERRPNPKTVAMVSDWIHQELRQAEKTAKNSSGRIPMRRLNRTEYANTLRDLFFLDDHFARGLEETLPMDGKVEGFDRGGAGLFIDEAQLATYLAAAELVLSREVFAPKPKTIHSKYLTGSVRLSKDGCVLLRTWSSLHKNAGRPGWTRRVPVGAKAVEFKKGGVEFLQKAFEPGELPEGTLRVNPEGGWWYGFSDPLSSGKFQDGWYRLKVRAGAFKGTGAHAVDEVKFMFHYAHNTSLEVKESVVIDAPLDQPKDYEMKVFLRAGSPEVQRRYTLSWNGLPAVVMNDPRLPQLDREVSKCYGRVQQLKSQKRPQAEIDEALKKLEACHDRFHQAAMEMKEAHVYNPKYDLQAIPRLWIGSFEIEGPIVNWPPRGRTELFFAGEPRSVSKRYLRDIFARFLPRAYRRPVEPKEIDAWVAWVLKAQRTYHLSDLEAFQEGIKAVLCSPDFLFIQEPTREADTPRPLTDHQLASRLSYFLWSTMPDAELFALANANTLHEPKTLQAQVKRMLADSKRMGLVRDFTGQWLKVREFSNVITDRNQYRDYDSELRDSSAREPLEFFKEVLDKDLSILNFVDSDFLVIDERLARHYGINGVKGNAFRRVPIRPEHRRGGVLGMAGVLTYLSDGIRTLPVRRASYVLDTLWNSPPPPPPPNAGDLPAIKGKNLTVRQRLDQHRASPICASCHARIDPFGIALENYDAIGAWRVRQNGERFRGDERSPPIDVSGGLPSGRKFRDLPEFKRALLSEKDRFLHGFVEKLLTYALGRPVGATDRETIDDLIKTIEAARTKNQEPYRLQSLIQAVVASQAFQTK